MCLPDVIRLASHLIQTEMMNTKIRQGCIASRRGILADERFVLIVTEPTTVCDRYVLYVVSHIADEPTVYDIYVCFMCCFTLCSEFEVIGKVVQRLFFFFFQFSICQWLAPCIHTFGAPVPVIIKP